MENNTNLAASITHVSPGSPRQDDKYDDVHCSHS